MSILNRYQVICDMIISVKEDQSIFYERPQYAISYHCKRLGLDYKIFKKLRDIHITQDEFAQIIDQLNQRLSEHIQMIDYIINGRLIISDNSKDDIKRQCEELGLNYELFSTLHIRDLTHQTLKSLIEQQDRLCVTEIKEPDTL